MNQFLSIVVCLFVCLFYYCLFFGCPPPKLQSKTWGRQLFWEMYRNTSLSNKVNLKGRYIITHEVFKVVSCKRHLNWLALAYFEPGFVIPRGWIKWFNNWEIKMNDCISNPIFFLFPCRRCFVGTHFSWVFF